MKAKYEEFMIRFENFKSLWSDLRFLINYKSLRLNLKRFKDLRKIIRAYFPTNLWFMEYKVKELHLKLQMICLWETKFEEFAILLDEYNWASNRVYPIFLLLPIWKCKEGRN